MELTRHFTATTYVVEGGATLLHEHKRLGMWLPPGGHVDRDELPHVAARREVAEETGLDVEIVADVDDIASDTVEPLPKPRHVQLADVNVHAGGEVSHQHVDLVFYAAADSRDVSPRSAEVPASEWEWFTAERLADDRLDPDVAEIGRRAIETVGSR